jgi:hypothetical protein
MTETAGFHFPHRATAVSNVNRIQKGASICTKVNLSGPTEPISPWSSHVLGDSSQDVRHHWTSKPRTWSFVCGEIHRLMRPVYETAFAETGGMQRLLDLWKRYEIQTSTYADGLNVSLFPELSREVAANGHEFLVQGWDHEFLCDMTTQEQADGSRGPTKPLKTCLAKRLRVSVLRAGTLRRKLFPSSPSKGSNTPAAWQCRSAVYHPGQQ